MAFLHKPEYCINIQNTIRGLRAVPLRSNSYDPQPERLGALDHCLVEAKNALRVETPGDRKVKRVARPQLPCVVTGQIGSAAEFLPSGNGYGAVLLREFADPRRGLRYE